MKYARERRFFGQEHSRPRRNFAKIIDSGKIPNMIFYGPSGTGKPSGKHHSKQN